MSNRGLDGILQRIRQGASKTLVDRYLALVAEIAGEREKAERSLDLAEALQTQGMTDDALAVAAMAHAADRANIRALDLMIAAMETKGRHAKADVLRTERNRIAGMGRTTMPEEQVRDREARRERDAGRRDREDNRDREPSRDRDREGNRDRESSRDRESQGSRDRDQQSSRGRESGRDRGRDSAGSRDRDASGQRSSRDALQRGGTPISPRAVRPPARRERGLDDDELETFQDDDDPSDADPDTGIDRERLRIGQGHDGRGDDPRWTGRRDSEPSARRRPGRDRDLNDLSDDDDADMSPEKPARRPESDVERARNRFRNPSLDDGARKSDSRPGRPRGDTETEAIAQNPPLGYRDELLARQRRRARIEKSKPPVRQAEQSSPANDDSDHYFPDPHDGNSEQTGGIPNIALNQEGTSEGSRRANAVRAQGGASLDLHEPRGEEPQPAPRRAAPTLVLESSDLGLDPNAADTGYQHQASEPPRMSRFDKLLAVGFSQQEAADLLRKHALRQALEEAAPAPVPAVAPVATVAAVPMVATVESAQPAAETIANPDENDATVIATMPDVPEKSKDTVDTNPVQSLGMTRGNNPAASFSALFDHYWTAGLFDAARELVDHTSEEHGLESWWRERNDRLKEIAPLIGTDQAAAAKPAASAEKEDFWEPIKRELLRLTEAGDLAILTEAAVERAATRPPKAWWQPGAASVKAVPGNSLTARRAQRIQAIVAANPRGRALPASFVAALAGMRPAPGGDQTKQNHVYWELVSALWGTAPDGACAKLLDELSLARAGTGFWGLYLDSLVYSGQSRRALVEVRRTLAANPQLAWARTAWQRLVAIHQALGLEAPHWHEDDGVAALRERLAVRARPKIAATLLLGAA